MAISLGILTQNVQVQSLLFRWALSVTKKKRTWAAHCHHDQTSKILLSVPQIKSQRGPWFFLSKKMGLAYRVVHESEWLININVSRRMYINLNTVYIIIHIHMIYTYIHIIYTLLCCTSSLWRGPNKKSLALRLLPSRRKNLGQAALHLQADCQGLQSTCTMPQPRWTRCTEGRGWWIGFVGKIFTGNQSYFPIPDAPCMEYLPTFGQFLG